MKRSRFTEQQIVGILKSAEAGVAVKELCRKHGISDATFYNWKARYGGMSASDPKRLKELGAENAKWHRPGIPDTFDRWEDDIGGVRREEEHLRRSSSVRR